MTMKTLFIVGVGGGTGSGKTLFAEALRAAMPTVAEIVDHDSYYRDLSVLPIDSRAKVNFDHPQALETELLCRHLDDLRDGMSINKPTYCFETHTRRNETVQIAANPIVIVEGIFVLAEAELRKRIDLKLYIDTPSDIRLLRRVVRDVVERKRTIESIADQYEKTVRIAHERFVSPSISFADIIVPGIEKFDQAVDFAARSLRHKISALGAV